MREETAGIEQPQNCMEEYKEYIEYICGAFCGAVICCAAINGITHIYLV